MPNLKMAPQITIQSTFSTDEIVRSFMINWIGDDKKIYFDGCVADVVSGFYGINQMIFDYNCGNGFATVADFLRLIMREDLITIYPETEDWGWISDSLITDCDSYFLNFRLIPIKGKKNTYEILPEWFPNDHIFRRMSEID